MVASESSDGGSGGNGLSQKESMVGPVSEVVFTNMLSSARAAQGLLPQGTSPQFQLLSALAVGGGLQGYIDAGYRAKFSDSDKVPTFDEILSETHPTDGLDIILGRMMPNCQVEEGLPGEPDVSSSAAMLNLLTKGALVALKDSSFSEMPAQQILIAKDHTSLAIYLVAKASDYGMPLSVAYRIVMDNVEGGDSDRGLSPESLAEMGKVIEDDYRAYLEAKYSSEESTDAIGPDGSQEDFTI